MNVLRVATYNIHKGVKGLGPKRRLEIHNLGHAVEQFDADIVCLQEVRKVHRRQEQYFSRWPDLPQADFLAPEGYEAVYRTNAYTRHGEHGNALLSRWPVISHQHEDMSDHRFEQRGLLHTEVLVNGKYIHVVVVHLGLISSSRLRQVALWCVKSLLMPP
jgi:endonuclease/exonuclease/phosphatase family metal-dependent hydrolase